MAVFWNVLSETTVSLYQFAGRSIPEDGHICLLLITRICPYVHTREQTIESIHIDLILLSFSFPQFELSDRFSSSTLIYIQREFHPSIFFAEAMKPSSWQSITPSAPEASVMATPAARNPISLLFPHWASYHYSLTHKPTTLFPAWYLGRPDTIRKINVCWQNHWLGIHSRSNRSVVTLGRCEEPAFLLRDVCDLNYGYKTVCTEWDVIKFLRFFWDSAFKLRSSTSFR